MKNTIILLLFYFGSFQIIIAQNTDGKITYERKSDWIKIQSKATYLSKEEKDRMAQTWKNDSDYKEKMVLVFNENGSHYTYQNKQGESEDGTYKWLHPDFIITRDFEKNQMFEIHETLGKTYILEDEMKFSRWKILNEIKDIGGYVCMKASTIDSIKNQNIVAWFSTDIPVSVGPERMGGLPGLVLELDVDEGAVVLTAVEILLNSNEPIPDLPKKIRGKKINEAEFNSKIYTYIKQQEQMHNFAWGIRY